MECSRHLQASGIGMMEKSDLVHPWLRGAEYPERECRLNKCHRGCWRSRGQSSGYSLLERSMAGGFPGQASWRHPRVTGGGSCLRRGGGSLGLPGCRRPRGEAIGAPNGRVRGWTGSGVAASRASRLRALGSCLSSLCWLPLSWASFSGKFMPPAQPATGKESHQSCKHVTPRLSISH